MQSFVGLPAALACAFWFTLVASITLPNHALKFDTNGNLLDAHDGKVYYFDGMYYLYGVSYNCGFRWRTSNFTTPFCGMKVYSSPDLLTWTDEGFVFNAQTQEWQSRCADVAACFRPKAVRNPKTGEYVFWMNEGASLHSYTAFISMSPTGPFVEKNQPWMPYSRGDDSYGNGDFGLVVGPEGKGYAAFDTTPHVSGPSYWVRPNITYGIVIELSDDYTNTTGNYVVTELANVEAFDMIYRKGWWYLIFGRICGYCTSTDTSFIKSRSPMGPWLAKDRVYFTDNSCGGQHNMVAQLPSSEPTGDDIYLYGSDLWTGDVNEGKAGSHWEPLTFLDNGDIAPLKCNEKSYELNVKTSPPKAKDVLKTAVAASYPRGNYSWTCGFGRGDRSVIYQFFQVNSTGNITEIGVNVAQEANNADMQMSLVQVPDISTLWEPTGIVKSRWSQSYPIRSVGWSFPIIKGQMSIPVKTGEWFGISLASRAVSIPYCYLERDIKPGSCSDPGSQGSHSGWMGEIQQGKYPLYPVPGKELRYYVKVTS